MGSQAKVVLNRDKDKEKKTQDTKTGTKQETVPGVIRQTRTMTQRKLETNIRQGKARRPRQD